MPSVGNSASNSSFRGLRIPVVDFRRQRKSPGSGNRGSTHRKMVGMAGFEPTTIGEITQISWST